MQFVKFSEKISIERDPYFLFDYTQDYDQRLVWDTFLKKAELLEGAKKAAIGVRAYCVAHNGLGMQTEYITFNRPKTTAIKMAKAHLLFKAFQGSWVFKELAEEHTEVTFVYSYKLRFPFNLVSPLIKKKAAK